MASPLQSEISRNLRLSFTLAVFRFGRGSWLWTQCVAECSNFDTEFTESEIAVAADFSFFGDVTDRLALNLIRGPGDTDRGNYILYGHLR